MILAPTRRSARPTPATHGPRASRAWSARQQLAALVVAILAPVLLFAGLLAWTYAERERDRYEAQVRDLARDILAAVDRDLTGLEAATQALSTSRALKRGDLATFYQRAGEAKAFNGTNVVVRDPTGQQLLNTRLPFGAPLPRSNTEPDRLAAAERRPVVSDLFEGVVAHEYVFVVAAPVFAESAGGGAAGGEAIASFINLSLSPARVAEIIQREGVPEGWSAGVVDRKGIAVARVPEHAAYVGRPASERFMRLATGSEGLYENVNFEGVPVLTAYARSSRFGWTATANVPRAVVAAPLRRSLLLLAGLGAGLTALSTLLALWFGRRLAGPMQRLAAQAAALGRGEAVAPVATGLREVNQVGAEIARAAALRRAAEAALAEAGAAQRRLNAELAAQATELRESNEEMQRYAYIVSHDLRAPLVNIMGFTSEIEEVRAEVGAALAGHARAAALDGDLAEAVGFIRASATKMDGLINAILRLSREGRRTMRPEPLAMSALVGRLADAIRHQTERAGAEIAVAPDLPDLVADRLAVEAVFGNLLDNAVKYLAAGRPGRIAVTGEVAGTASGTVVYRVVDNGRGIAERDLGRVFELFRRAGAQDRPGEGIGLAQVKATVRALGGTIALTSREGEGSTFTVALPTRAPEPNTET